LIPAPFEVIVTGAGFSWRIIGHCGRPLVCPADRYPSDFEAAAAARAWRNRFTELAKRVDAA